jgi:hypothetical protein
MRLWDEAMQQRRHTTAFARRSGEGKPTAQFSINPNAYSNSLPTMMRLLLVSACAAFVARLSPAPFLKTTSRGAFSVLSSSEIATEETISVDPKEAVKLFGRLAEKYILLDASGGMCCYSACSDWYVKDLVKILDCRVAIRSNHTFILGSLGLHFP